MNERLRGYVDFTAKTFIFLFAFYLMVHAFTVTEMKQLQRKMDEVKTEAAKLSEQTKSINNHVTMLNFRNPEMLFHSAMAAEAGQDLNKAIRSTRLAISLGETNMERYNQKLVELLQKKATLQIP